MSLDPQSVDIQKVKSKKVWDEISPMFEIGSYQNFESTFVFRMATTAGSLTDDVLSDMFNKITIDQGSNMVFLFGKMDLDSRLPIRKNTYEVVDQYFKVCAEFAKKHGCNPRFVGPMYGGDSEEYDKFINKLGYNCYINNIPQPIILIDSLIPRNYPHGDIWGHMTYEDNKKSIEYILDQLQAGI